MSGSHLRTAADESDETASEPQARIASERKLVADAERDIDAGRGIDWSVVEPWLHELDRDESAAAPGSEKSSA